MRKKVFWVVSKTQKRPDPTSLGTFGHPFRDTGSDQPAVGLICDHRGRRKNFAVAVVNNPNVYLCLHGSRHGWQKLLWVCDINELIRNTENSSAAIDWLAVRKHAHVNGCEKTLELGLFLINSFFGRRVVYPEIVRILSDKTYQRIGEFVRRNTFACLRLSTRCITSSGLSG